MDGKGVLAKVQDAQWLDLQEQEIVSGSDISWTICRHIITPASYHSVFLQAGCPSCRPTSSVKALKECQKIINID